MCLSQPAEHPPPPLLLKIPIVPIYEICDRNSSEYFFRMLLISSHLFSAYVEHPDFFKEVRVQSKGIGIATERSDCVWAIKPYPKLKAQFHPHSLIRQ